MQAVSGQFWNHSAGTESSQGSWASGERPDGRGQFEYLADPKPPAGIVVTLVGYAADGKITLVSRQSDVKGIATFTGLDTRELTAYFAFAMLPIVDYARFNGYYTGQASIFLQKTVGKYIR